MKEEDWPVSIFIPMENIAEAWTLFDATNDWLAEHIGKRYDEWNFYIGRWSKDIPFAKMTFRNETAAVLFKLRWE